MTAAEGIIYLQEKFPNPKEPVFILRAQDVFAANTVLLWGQSAEIGGVNEEKVCGAIKAAMEMRKWPTFKIPD
jgi:hypothetical protein